MALWLIIGLIAGLAAAGITFTLRDSYRARQQKSAKVAAEQTATRILEEAKKEAKAIRKEGESRMRESLVQTKTQAEQATRQRRSELDERERQLQEKNDALTRASDRLEKHKTELTQAEQKLARAEEKMVQQEEGLQRQAEEHARLQDEVRGQLERVAGLTRDEAKRSLIDQMVEEARFDASKRVRQIEELAREDADRRARKIVTIAIERLAGEFITERTVSVVQLPSDDMKGRIIGREGRNIRAIEAATGVDLIVDDTPEAVIVSCHNPIRRKIACLALETLLSDGRIHPGRIEEVVRRAEQELDEDVRDAGQRAILEARIHGVHPELVKLLGMLKYRYSYAQNVLSHSLEAAFICGAMAAELGINENQARRAALLHDIGKALTHEVEGSHAVIGGDIARRYGESAKIVNAIAAHHEEVKAETVLAPLVDAADALSGARPGARREVLESYVKRLEDLERISNAFQGVEKSFAVQAGREIRIIVDPGSINDDAANVIARDVARKIEAEMTYPGQIKVTVIRETRASEFAR
jgi:ribonuclease Y